MPNHIPRGKIIICLLYLVTAPGALAVASQTIIPPTQVEQFKDFLENRPQIAELTFKRTLNPDLYPANAKPKPQFFHCRWKNPAMFTVQELFTHDDLDAIGESVQYNGQSNSLIWRVMGDQLYQLSRSESSTPDKNLTQGEGLFVPLKNAADQALSCFVMHLRNGSLHWKELEFEASTDEEQPRRIRGHLETSEGWVTKIIYGFGRFNQGCEVQCEYDTDIASPLPARFRLYRNDGGERVLLGGIEIRYIKLSNELLEDSVFDPNRFIDRRNDSVFYYTNNNYYYRTFGPKGFLTLPTTTVRNLAGVPSRRLLEPKSMWSSLTPRVIYFAVGCLILLLPIAWLIGLRPLTRAKYMRTNRR